MELASTLSKITTSRFLAGKDKASPWIISQKWRHLIFAHWPVPAETLQPHIPPELELDSFDGQTWVSIVAFHLRGIHLRGLPPVPFTSAFPELNVRTYVLAGDKPGVRFLSLDADNWLGSTIARQVYFLPYLNARMSLVWQGDELVCHSKRPQRGSPPACFSAVYRASSPPFQPNPGSLDHWLIERYYFYVNDTFGRLHRGEVRHEPWTLQSAEAVITENTMMLSHGLCLPNTQPLLHYAEGMEALFPYLESV